MPPTPDASPANFLLEISPDPSPWPAKIASSDKVRDVKISPDGSLVLYQVQPFYRTGPRSVSTLWLAETDVPQSARPLTNGSFNNRAGVFHPDGKQILFLSDKECPGNCSHIYTLDLQISESTRSDSQPHLLNSESRRVQAFEISPDGRLIAFTSKNGAGRNGEEKDDPRVFDAFSIRSPGSAMEREVKLQIYNFTTGTTIAVDGIHRDVYIEAFTWSPDSRKVLYRLRPGRGRGPESPEQEISLQSILVDEPNPSPFVVGTYRRSPSGQNVWACTGHIVSLQNYEPRNILDARALFADREDTFTCGDADGRRLYGISEDAVRIVNANHVPEEYGKHIAVEISSDVDTHIDIVALDATASAEPKKLFTLFRTQDEAIWFGAWDAKKVINGNDGSVWYVFAAVLSSGVKHEAPNVWTVRVASDGMQRTKVRLSSHLHWLAEAPVFTTHVIRWKAADGVELSGLVRYPPGYDASMGPLPAVLFIHGGPYRCVTIRA